MIKGRPRGIAAETVRAVVWSMCLLAPVGCGNSPVGEASDAGEAGADATATFPRASLLKPQTCRSCHADHFNDWTLSMHAFAADDPIFRAMNARGQRETDGGLGTFCVSCHAPMAVRDLKTTDGLNLDDLPPEYHGVTCFFCHSIASVDGVSNAAVTLSDDLVMRGEYHSPVPNAAHQAAYSTFQDITSVDSDSACGACHDIVVPAHLTGAAGDAGTDIERTFSEWKASGFGPDAGAQGCGASSCHMVVSTTTRPIAQMTGYPARATTLPARDFHGHDFPAIDVALPTGPDAGVLEGGAPVPPGVQQLLSNALIGDLCVTELGGIRVIVDMPNVGHDFPSGAAQDRRFWAEIVAYRAGAVVYQTGVVPFGTPAFDAGADPDLWLMRDCIFGSQKQEVNMFWQAASTDGNELTPSPPGFGSGQRMRLFPVSKNPIPGGQPDRVTLNLWVQAVGPDVLADLVASGDLDPAVAAAVPTLSVSLGNQTDDGGISPQLVWTPEAAAAGGVLSFQDYDGTVATCVGTLPTPLPAAAPTHMNCSP